MAPVGFAFIPSLSPGKFSEYDKRIMVYIKATFFSTSLVGKAPDKETLGGDKVNMLITTYPHKPMREIIK